MNWKNVGLGMLGLVGAGFVYVLWKTHQSQAVAASDASNQASNAASQQNALASILSAFNSSQSNSAPSTIQPIKDQSSNSQNSNQNSSSQNSQNSLSNYGGADYNEIYDQLANITQLLQTQKNGGNIAAQLPTQGLQYIPSMSQAPNTVGQSAGYMYPSSYNNLPVVNSPSIQAVQPVSINMSNYLPAPAQPQTQLQSPAQNQPQQSSYQPPSITIARPFSSTKSSSGVN